MLRAISYVLTFSGGAVLDVYKRQGMECRDF